MIRGARGGGSKAVTTEGTKDHRGSRRLMNVDLFDAVQLAVRRMDLRGHINNGVVMPRELMVTDELMASELMVKDGSADHKRGRPGAVARAR